MTEGAADDAEAQHAAATALRRAADVLDARAAAAVHAATVHDAWLLGCELQEEMLVEVDAEVEERLRRAEEVAAAIVADAQRATAALRAAAVLRTAAALRTGSGAPVEETEGSSEVAADVQRLVEGLEDRIGHRLDLLERAIARVEDRQRAEDPAAPPSWREDGGEGRPEVDESPPGPNRGRWLARVAVTLVLALLASTVIRATVGEIYVVASDSMEPELSDGDRVIVNRAVYRLDDPDHGDVVVFDTTDLRVAGWDLAPRLVKRVVAVGGQTVEGTGSRILVDGEPLVGDWVPDLPAGAFGPVKVPDGAIFVMGDNYALSLDSRAFGVVDVDAVVGRVEAVVWPPVDAGGV